MNQEMTREEIIEIFRNWYMPNFFNLDIYDYRKLTDEEVYEIYIEERENFEDLNEVLSSHQ